MVSSQVSANSLAAEALGMADRLGSLAPGYDADIIALDGDPLTDLGAARGVRHARRRRYKWAGGKVKWTVRQPDNVVLLHSL